MFNRLLKTLFLSDLLLKTSFDIIFIDLVKSGMDRVPVVCKLAMQWYLMRMCSSWLRPFNTWGKRLFWAEREREGLGGADNELTLTHR